MLEPVTTNQEWLGLVDDIRAGWFDKEARELAPGFALAEDDVLVDVGAGAGGFAQYCARYAGRVVLIEPDAEALAATVLRLKASGAQNIEGITGDAAAIPLPDAFATRIACTEVLEHVDDPAQVMAELVRIGRPGALYLLTVPGAASERLQGKVAPELYFQKPNHIRVFNDGELARLAETAGLEVVSHNERGFYQTLWWLFFWETGLNPPRVGAGEPQPEVAHPLLEAWQRTWGLLLATEGGDRIKAALDDLAPKSVAIVARKPL